ncbi:MAG: hypothetical protein AAGF11_49480 [Myxococcota bacterium]
MRFLLNPTAVPSALRALSTERVSPPAKVRLADGGDVGQPPML